MTRLAVRPLDLTGPGSWKARAAYFKAVELMRRVDRAQQAGETPAIDDVLGAFAARDSLILPRLYIKENSGPPTTVEAILEEIAATEFDQLAVQMLAGAEEDGAAVPTPSGTPSPARSRSRKMLASAHPNGSSGSS